MKQRINLIHAGICENKLFVALEGTVYDCNHLVKPRVLLWFENGKEDRNFSLRITDVQYDSNGVCRFKGGFYCSLNCIFWSTKKQNLPFKLHFDVICGDERKERVDFYANPRDFVLRRNDYDLELCGRTELAFHPLQLETTGNGPIKKLRKSAVHVLLAVATLISIPWGLIELMASAGDCVPFEKKRRFVYEKKSEGVPFNRSDKIFVLYNNSLRRIKKGLIRMGYAVLARLPKRNQSVSFISQRSDQLEGNFKFVYDELKKHPQIKLRFFLNLRTIERMTYLDIFRFCKACAFSQVVLVDEYVPSMYTIKLRKPTKLIQLWHACGAFKTFGFSRIGMPGAPTQASPAHRNYDYVTVSSSNIRIWYAQGFGLPMKAIVPTGVPRTDMFSDPQYVEQVRKQFYEKYPQLKTKKILLFAPTFRGNGKETAYYPMEKFQPEKIYEQTGREYAILIKQHPFVPDRIEIPDQYKDVILDMSDFPEINDLLFVSDLVITDYSSLIFEASLLELPMLFYVYDLEEYTNERDFYFDFGPTIPGKKVFSQSELIKAINESDFEQEKVKGFSEKYFDDHDGKSTERVTKLILNLVQGKNYEKN